MTHTPRLEKPTAFFFDWDNTLAENWQAVEEAINAARQSCGLPAWSPQEVKNNAKLSLRDNFPRWFGEKWEDARDVFYENFKVQHLKTIRLLPAVDELLTFLTAEKIPCAIISNKSGEYLRSEVTTLGLLHHFFAIIGAGDAEKDKPDRAVIDKAKKELLEMQTRNIWFVGDTDVDMECARTGECIAVLVNSDEVQAKTIKADHYLRSCKELLTLVKQFF